MTVNEAKDALQQRANQLGLKGRIRFTFFNKEIDEIFFDSNIGYSTNISKSTDLKLMTLARYSLRAIK